MFVTSNQNAQVRFLPAPGFGLGRVVASFSRFIYLWFYGFFLLVFWILPLVVGICCVAR